MTEATARLRAAVGRHGRSGRVGWPNGRPSTPTCSTRRWPCTTSTATRAARSAGSASWTRRGRSGPAPPWARNGPPGPSSPRPLATRLAAARREARTLIGGVTAPAGVDGFDLPELAGAVTAHRAVGGRPRRRPRRWPTTWTATIDLLTESYAALRDRAAALVAEHEDRWAPIALQLAQWVDLARQADAAAPEIDGGEAGRRLAQGERRDAAQPADRAAGRPGPAHLGHAAAGEQRGPRRHPPGGCRDPAARRAAGVRRRRGGRRARA